MYGLTLNNSPNHENENLIINSTLRVINIYFFIVYACLYVNSIQVILDVINLFNKVGSKKYT